MPRSQDAAPPRRSRRSLLLLVLLAGMLMLLAAGCTDSQSASLGKISVEASAGNGQPMSTGVQLMVLITALTLAPSAMIMMTSFTRIVIVLGFLRSAIGVPQLPPNQVVVGLALFLSIFVMAPTWKDINDQALQPMLAGQISQQQALDRAEGPIRAFMLKQTREQDLALMVSLSKAPQPNTVADVPTWVMIPAFTISELKTAFQMGFIIYIPFLIIDLVVSSSLMSMGMMFLPPVMISLPFKILLFVLVDGWHLVVRSLVLSFG